MTLSGVIGLNGQPIIHSNGSVDLGPNPFPYILVGVLGLNGLPIIHAVDGRVDLGAYPVFGAAAPKLASWNAVRPAYGM